MTIYTFAGSRSGVFPPFGEWLQDRQQCPVSGTLCLNAAARGILPNHESTSFLITWLSMNSRLLKEHAKTLTWPTRSIVLPSLLLWLSSWSPGHPLLSACWSPYPRPVPTLGPCHRLFPLPGTLFLQISLWWPPSLLGVSARMPPSWWVLPKHAFNSAVSHQLQHQNSYSSIFVFS